MLSGWLLLQWNLIPLLWVWRNTWGEMLDFKSVLLQKSNEYQSVIAPLCHFLLQKEKRKKKKKILLKKKIIAWEDTASIQSISNYDKLSHCKTLLERMKIWWRSPWGSLHLHQSPATLHHFPASWNVWEIFWACHFRTSLLHSALSVEARLDCKLTSVGSPCP